MARAPTELNLSIILALGLALELGLALSLAGAGAGAGARAGAGVSMATWICFDGMETAGEEEKEEGEWKNEERRLVCAVAAVGRRATVVDGGERASLLSRTELSQSLWKNLSSTKRCFTIWRKEGDSLITRMRRVMSDATSSAMRRHARSCDASCKRKSSRCVSRKAKRDL